jgi:hypothetical protein
MKTIKIMQLVAGITLVFFSAAVFAQDADAVKETGIIIWMSNIKGAAIYAVQFFMLMAFAVGLYYLYAGVAAGKANLGGDKQNNSVGKILGNVVAGIILMGGVSTIETLSGTLFGGSTTAGGQAEASKKMSGSGSGTGL